MYLHLAPLLLGVPRWLRVDLHSVHHQLLVEGHAHHLVLLPAVAEVAHQAGVHELAWIDDDSIY